MNEKIVEGLNRQINMELYSAYLYLEINNYFLRRGLVGFAHWYAVQSHEECEHAMRIYRFLHDEGETVDLQPIARPDGPFTSDAAVVAFALTHERLVTQCIHEIYDLAFASHDHRVMRFLDWFVDEQTEEEVNANAIVDKLRLFGGDASGLLLLDREMGDRGK